MRVVAYKLLRIKVSHQIFLMSEPNTLALNRIPRAGMAGVAACIATFVLMYFLVPYTSGYSSDENRATVLSSVLHGYNHIENGEWGFGYAVLPIALVMLWFTRERFRGLEMKPSHWGLMLILFSFAFYLIGFKANQKYIGFFAGHTFIAAVVVWFLGWKYFFKAFWLWVFLGMMWPLTPLIDLISFPLRKAATEMTVMIWNFCGGSALQNGTAIMSAGNGELVDGDKYSLQIAAACSGLRSLFALLMISLVFAYIGVKKSWHRFFVVGMMVPVAILGNVVRILMLLGGTVLWGNDFAVGTDANPSAFHLGAGFAVYFIALCCMFAIVAIFNDGFRKLLRPRKVVSRRLEGSV